jgi:hypothetical protein
MYIIQTTIIHKTITIISTYHHNLIDFCPHVLVLTFDPGHFLVKYFRLMIFGCHHFEIAPRDPSQTASLDVALAIGPAL